MGRLIEASDMKNFGGICKDLSEVVAAVLALGGHLVVDNEGDSPHIEIHYLGRRIRMSPTTGIDPIQSRALDEFSSGMSREETGYRGLCFIAALHCRLLEESRLRGA